MTAPNILEQALLSMDAYEANGLNPVGNVGRFSSAQISFDASTGFLARKYEFDGGMVLAFAGTNNPFDVWSGWGGGLHGSPLSTQYWQAAKLYRQQNDDEITTNPQIYVTGHSLGGGLAGFVGALYGVSATVFNNINFMGAAKGVYDLAKGITVNGVTGPLHPLFRQEFYQGHTPPFAPSTYSVGGRHLTGEVAGLVRAGNWSPPVEYTPFTQLDLNELHKMNLMVLTIFGNLQVDTSWYSIANAYGRALFDGQVSVGISGMANAEQMRTKIAYSVVEDGTLVFGNVAARALYNDLNDIANILETSSLNPLLDDPDLTEALAQIAVQFAGDLAEQKSESTSDKKGVVDFDSSEGLFSIDFDHLRWEKSSTGDASTIAGRDNFINVLFDVADVDPGKWHGTASEVTQIKGATGSSSALLASDAPDQKNSNPGAAILIGGEDDDELQGGDGHDVLIGGDGNDLLRGGNGQDLLVGGDGDDTFLLEIDREADAGENTGTYIGGQGNDTFIVTALRDFESPTVEFRIENAEASDRLYAAYDLFNGTNGDWQGSDLLPLLGGIINIDNGTMSDLRSGVTNAYFEWMRESDLHRGNPDWGGVGSWYHDQTEGIIKFVGNIEYTFDGDDLLVHLYAGGEELDYFADPENETWITTNVNFFYPDTETIIRIVDFDDGDLGFDFHSLPEADGNGFVAGWDSAVSDMTNNGQFGNPVSFQSPSTIVGEESDPENDPAGIAPARGDAGAGQTFNGTSSSENLNGTSADDTFTLTGDGGTDTYAAGAGFDVILGSSGNDILRVVSGLTNLGGIEEINGGDGSDQIVGTSGNDVFDFSGVSIENIEFIDLGDGNDSVIGTAGDDVFAGGAGSDAHDGADGFDTVYYGGSSSLTLDLATPANSTGNAAGDTFQSIEWFVLSSVGDTFVGSSGADGVDGGLGNDTLNGGDGDDVLEGGGGADTLNGGDGIDTASYATGTALVLDRVTPANSTGDAAGDTFNSIEQFVLTGGADTFNGSGQWETVDGGAGNDTLNGGGGNDTLIGGAGSDQLAGGSGTDTASYRTSLALTLDLGTPANSTGDAAGDTFNSIEWFELTDGDDVFVGGSSTNRVIGGAGDDLLTGGASDDVLIGGAGADAMDGGGAYDTAAYDSATSAITINILNTSNGIGDAKGDTFTNIEKFRMTAFNDTFIGGASGESIHGEGGADILNGGGGNDDLYGGAGDDTFVFGAGFGKDKIYDFNTLPGEHDVISFEGGLFSTYGQVQSAMSQVGSDVVITYDSATTLTVKNTTVAGLTSDYFVL